jgi:acetyl-CoA synthetase
MSEQHITSVLKETRKFSPSTDFAKQAHVKSLQEYRALWQRAKDNPDVFWAEQAKSLHWFTPWTKVQEWNEPFVKWFVGGKTNVSYNCLDRHLTSATKNKAAIIWEGEPGDRQVWRYQDLHREVCKFANVL